MSSCLSICRRYARLLPRVVTVVLAASLSAGAWAVNPKLVIGQRHMLLLTTEGAVWSWGESNTGYPVLGRGREAGSAPARASPGTRVRAPGRIRRQHAGKAQ